MNSNLSSCPGFPPIRLVRARASFSGAVSSEIRSGIASLLSDVTGAVSPRPLLLPSEGVASLEKYALNLTADMDIDSLSD